MGELDGFLLILYPALLSCVRWIEAKYGKRADTAHGDLGEFMLVVRRAMLLVTNWIAARNNL
jgi:hypothetical protein